MNYKRLLTLILLILLVIIAISSCFILKSNFKSYNNFSNPDKIIIHVSGKNKVIYKWNPLYGKMLKAADKRFTSDINFYMLHMDTNDLLNYEKDKTYVEYVYSKKESTNYFVNRKNIKFTYNLIFPLSGKYYKCVFFDESGNCSGPISSLLLPDEMLKLIK